MEKPTQKNYQALADKVETLLDLNGVCIDEILKAYGPKQVGYGDLSGYNIPKGYFKSNAHAYAFSMHRSFHHNVIAPAIGMIESITASNSDVYWPPEKHLNSLHHFLNSIVDEMLNPFSYPEMTASGRKKIADNFEAAIKEIKEFATLYGIDLGRRKNEPENKATLREIIIAPCEQINALLQVRLTKLQRDFGTDLSTRDDATEEIFSHLYSAQRGVQHLIDVLQDESTGSINRSTFAGYQGKRSPHLDNLDKVIGDMPEAEKSPCKMLLKN